MRQITPNSYECLGQVLVGMAPPQATGLPHPTPIYRLCRTRFQLGAAVLTPSCVSCGLDSIGACEDCGRRLCGRHGTTSGPFLCGDCLRRRQAERADTEAMSAQREAKRKKREREELVAVLTGSDDPGEVAAALRRFEHMADRDQCRNAWRRLIRAVNLAPTHDCVEVSGRGSILHPWREVPESRIAVWRAVGVGSYRNPANREVQEERKTDIDLFLAADGSSWRSTGMEGGFSRTQRTVSYRIVLPRGAVFETRRHGGGYIEVPGSAGIESWSSPQMRDEKGFEGKFDYARAVAAILKEVA